MSKSKKAKEQIAEVGVELSQITEAEWNTMKILALDIRKSGLVGKDLFKSAVHAFIHWMQDNEVQIQIAVEERDENPGAIH